MDNESDENVEEPSKEESKDDEAFAKDEQIIHTNSGELLMVRKIFLSPKDDTEDK